MHALVARFRGQGNLLDRIRLLFAALIAYGLVGALLRVASHDDTTLALDVVVCATAVVQTLWAWLYYRRGRPGVVLDVLPLVVLTAQGLIIADASYATAGLYGALFLQLLYPLSWLRGAMLVTGYGVAITLVNGAAGRPVAATAADVFTFLAVGTVMQAVYATVTRHERRRRRDAMLTEVSASLLSTRDPQEVARRLVDGAVQLVEAGMCTLWTEEEGVLVRRALAGVDEYPLHELPMDALPPDLLRTYHDGQVVLLDRDTIAALEALQGPSSQQLESAAAMPLLRNGIVNGVVVVASRHAMDDDLMELLPRFSHEASLALDLADQHALFTGIVENSADVFLVVGDDDRIRYASPALAVMGGPSVDAALGLPLAELLVPVDVAPNEQGTAEPYRLVRPGRRTPLDVEVAARPLATGGRILNVRDVGDRRRLEAEISYRANHDVVTGLANRAAFMERLGTILRQPAGGRGLLAVMMLDLDDFKRVNDTYGHATGDAVLATVGRRIADATRGLDMAARFGGDEFALLLPDLGDPDEAAVIADRLLRALEDPVQLDGRTVALGASIGVAVASEDVTEGEVLLRDADAAMYHAKASGKGMRSVFDPGMHAELTERASLHRELEGAMGTSQLWVAYQPIMPLGAPAHPVGFEALLRWDHPDRGPVSPGEFVPLAEETGLIVTLGRWVLDEACQQLAAWDASTADGPAPYMSVNLSSVQLMSPDVVGDVSAVLARSGLSPSRLVLEVTETALMTDVAHVASVLTALKGLGVRIAIDDFGTGYSSFVHLKHFPVDVLKVDRSFVATVTDGIDEAALAEAIVKLAARLQIDTVAEGVETADQARQLEAWGCRHGQGWLWAPALAPADAGGLVGAPRLLPAGAGDPTAA